MITELNERSREIFRYIVDSYLETGTPVGSVTISKYAGMSISPASIRNAMADMESMGLLRAPHTSAGRIPTEFGLRLYIDGLMEMGRLSQEERDHIKNECTIKGLSSEDMMTKASSLLSNLSSCASLVIAPKIDKAIKQVQFIPLEPGRILVILVMQNGMVENRIMDVESNLPQSALIAASNYLNAKLSGKTITAAQTEILSEIRENKSQLDAITAKLVERGLEIPLRGSEGHIIIRGQSRLLEDVKAITDLERARTLLSYLEEQENMLKLLDNVSGAQGVQIFIGTENKIFDQTGWSLIISPYKNAQEKIVGAIGVIGPTRLDYDRIIPMVDYTSKVITKLIDEL